MKMFIGAPYKIFVSLNNNNDVGIDVNPFFISKVIFQFILIKCKYCLGFRK